MGFHGGQPSKKQRLLMNYWSCKDTELEKFGIELELIRLDSQFIMKCALGGKGKGPHGQFNR